MINKYKPHVLVFPEDDADRQLARGFELEIDPKQASKFQVLPIANGWSKLKDKFGSNHVESMRSYKDRHMVLLVDFDQQQDRREVLLREVPEDIRKRVFVVGSWSDPEGLRRAGLGTFEEIGRRLANECREGSDAVWGHDLLKHNDSEVIRMRDVLRPILF